MVVYPAQTTLNDLVTSWWQNTGGLGPDAPSGCIPVSRWDKTWVTTSPFADFTVKKSRYMHQGRNCHIIQICPLSAQSREKESGSSYGGSQCRSEDTASPTWCPFSIFPYAMYMSVEKKN